MAYLIKNEMIPYYLNNKLIVTDGVSTKVTIDDVIHAEIITYPPQGSFSEDVILGLIQKPFVDFAISCGGAGDMTAEMITQKYGSQIPTALVNTLVESFCREYDNYIIIPEGVSIAITAAPVVSIFELMDIDFGVSDLNIENGDGEYSLVGGYGSKAITDYSIAIGYNNISGSKGFYIRNIDYVNKKIYLSNEKYNNGFNDPTDNTDTTFETPEYAKGDLFSILGFVNLGGDGENHFHFCGEIVSVSNNVIDYKEDLPFTELLDTSDEDFPMFLVPKKAMVGSHVVGNKCFSEGDSNVSGGLASHAEGRGNSAAGKYADAEGRNTKAGYASHAEGLSTNAIGMYAHAEGRGANAIGKQSHAEGDTTTALGNSAHAEGTNTTSSGESAHAEGRSTQAIGSNSHAEGTGTKAEGIYGSHSEGNSTHAEGESSHAEGTNTHSVGRGSHAEGHRTEAMGTSSHAEGYYVKAIGPGAHAEGSGQYNEDKTLIKYNIAEGTGAHAEGHITSATGAGSHSEGQITSATGAGSHSEGQSSEASADYSHAEGNGSKALGIAAHAEGQSIASGSYSHSEGNGTTASGQNSHAEGVGTKSTAYGSHSEGDSTQATVWGSHTEGIKTKAVASAQGGHAEGYGTSVSGQYAHAEGYGTSAHGTAQHVQGKYNIESSIHAHIVGNGTDANNRSNAHTLDWSGNAWYAGSITVGRDTTDDDTDFVLVSKGYLKSCLEALKSEILSEVKNS